MFVMAVSYTALFAALTMLRMRTEIARRRLRTMRMAVGQMDGANG
jgi:hypothetical protein